MSWKTAALVGTFTIALAGTPLAVERIPRPDVPDGHRGIRRIQTVLEWPRCRHAELYLRTGSRSGVDWFFIGPQATVFDADVQQILTHYQSKNPFRGDALHATWQDSDDTSAVWAVKRAGSSDSELRGQEGN